MKVMLDFGLFVDHRELFEKKKNRILWKICHIWFLVNDKKKSKNQSFKKSKKNSYEIIVGRYSFAFDVGLDY